MLEIRKIQNPAIRSTVAAATAFAAITIIGAAVIGVINPKSKSADRFAVYASLAATGCGALFGLLVKSKVDDEGPSKALLNQQEMDTGSTDGKDWRNFVVVRKVKESEEITSFYLEPEDRGEIPDFQPGQFLTIKLDIPEQNKPIIRTYSLSDYTASGKYYRLSIKRESAPEGLDVMPGVASNFMHDQIQSGSVISVKPPSGKFILDVRKSLPAVLISNGVGITPMISMAKACSNLNSNRPIWFIHGARDGKFHAFREEVTAIAQQNPNLHLHFRYSRPNPEDAGSHHSTGHVDTALIREVVAPQLEEMHFSDVEYFLCGSPSFLKSLREGLKEWGVPENRVFYESFGTGTQVLAGSKPSAQKNGAVETAEIVFTKSGQTLTWREGDGTILEFAEANELEPAYSCRQGICLTCMCRIEEGEVAYQVPPTGTPEEGSVLICISKPKTPRVVLDL